MHTIFSHKLKESGENVVWWVEGIRKRLMEEGRSGEGGEVVGIIDKNEMKEIQKLLKTIKKLNNL